MKFFKFLRRFKGASFVALLLLFAIPAQAQQTMPDGSAMDGASIESYKANRGANSGDEFFVKRGAHIGDSMNFDDCLDFDMDICLSAWGPCEQETPFIGIPVPAILSVGLKFEYREPQALVEAVCTEGVSYYENEQNAVARVLSGALETDGDIKGPNGEEGQKCFKTIQKEYSVRPRFFHEAHVWGITPLGRYLSSGTLLQVTKSLICGIAGMGSDQFENVADLFESTDWGGAISGDIDETLAGVVSNPNVNMDAYALGGPDQFMSLQNIQMIDSAANIATQGTSIAQAAGTIIENVGMVTDSGWLCQASSVLGENAGVLDAAAAAFSGDYTVFGEGTYTLMGLEQDGGTGTRCWQQNNGYVFTQHDSSRDTQAGTERQYVGGRSNRQLSQYQVNGLYPACEGDRQQLNQQYSARAGSAVNLSQSSTQEAQGAVDGQIAQLGGSCNGGSPEGNWGAQAEGLTSDQRNEMYGQSQTAITQMNEPFGDSTAIGEIGNTANAMRSMVGAAEILMRPGMWQQMMVAMASSVLPIGIYPAYLSEMDQPSWRAERDPVLTEQLKGYMGIVGHLPCALNAIGEEVPGWMRGGGTSGGGGTYQGITAAASDWLPCVGTWGPLNPRTGLVWHRDSMVAAILSGYRGLTLATGVGEAVDDVAGASGMTGVSLGGLGTIRMRHDEAKSGEVQRFNLDFPHRSKCYAVGTPDPSWESKYGNVLGINTDIFRDPFTAAADGFGNIYNGVVNMFTGIFPEYYDTSTNTSRVVDPPTPGGPSPQNLNLTVEQEGILATYWKRTKCCLFLMSWGPYYYPEPCWEVEHYY